jgi:short-chain fatty acids transporter
MKKIVHFFTKLCEAYLPDAFVICLLLTLVVFGLCLAFTPYSIPSLIDFWGKEFWSLNGFAMQMIFVLISGHMLASSPLMKRVLEKICSHIHSESQALIVMGLFSSVACWINWGFGLIVSGILALEIGRKLKKLNFGLLVATAYSGFLVWHGGLSGSIPLKMAGKDEILQKVYPGLSIPLSESIFSPLNIVITLSCMALLPILALWMKSDVVVTVPEVPEPHVESKIASSLREKLEESRTINIIFFLIFLIYIFRALSSGESFDINKVNFIFLFLAILLHGSPMKFLKALQNSIVYASDLAIQFPFYAGIMGLMQYSGLSDFLSEQLILLANAHTLPFLTFLSGGLVNFFIPSGGGQWVVQGPVIMKTALGLNADPAKVAMGLAWGDAWTNLIQPFFALPLLAVARLKLKDIMGYCLVFTFFSGILISGILLF